MTLRLLSFVCLPLWFTAPCFAAAGNEKAAAPAVVAATPAAADAKLSTASGTEGAAWSSSLDSAVTPAPAEGMDSFAQAISGSPGTRPFSALGVAVKVGAEGVGFDVATPLARKLNVRAGASFFSYTHSLVEDGITINPDIRLRKGAASLDFYPFGGSFRVSPGVVFYNGNHATATANVPGGNTFTLNDATYTSSVTDPVRGSAEVSLGKKVAPSFTIGFGNIVPRNGKHWSVPFEVGFMYIDQPKFTYNLAGSACNQFGCQSVATSPDIQANIKAEQDQLNSDLSPLRFFPILSIGFGYRF